MRNPWFALGGAVLVGGVAIATPAVSAPSPSEAPLAKVNGEAITGADLQADFTRRHGGHQKFLMGPSEIRSFLEVVIDDRLLVQEAYRLGLQDADSVKTPTAEFAARKATEYLVRTEIEDKSRPTEKDVRAAWQDRTGTLYLVRRIVVDSRAQADSLAWQLAAGGDFDKLARQCSTDPSASDGGQLDWFGWGAMEPGWESVVFALHPGETTRPFETADGWEIVQLGAAEPVELADFKQASPRIEGILKKRRREAARLALSGLLWERYHVRRSDIELSPEGLHAAVVGNAEAPVATWDGGSLAVGKFVRGVDWTAMSGMSPARFRYEILDRLRDAVNADLVQREAMARHLDEVPEVAAAVKRYREDRMLAVLYDEYVLQGLSVSEEETRQYYDAHRKELTAPGKRRVSHLVVRTREEAEALRTEAAAGASFAELVKEHSVDKATANRGGDLGWIAAYDAKGELTVVMSLDEGTVSEPIESRFGWHLFVVTAIAPPQPVGYEEARAEIQRKALEKKQRAKRAQWVERLRQSAKISISDSAIQKFVQRSAPKS